MLFYNIDSDTRERMYLDLERARAKRALMESLKPMKRMHKEEIIK